MTYEPGVTVIAQGRKRVELGRNIFIYNATRFPLTAVDLPVVSPPHTGRRPVPQMAKHQEAAHGAALLLLT